MRIFVPLTDDMLDQLGKDDQLVPYQTGLSLLSQCCPDKPEQRLIPDEAPAGPRLSHPILQPCPH